MLTDSPTRCCTLARTQPMWHQLIQPHGLWSKIRSHTALCTHTPDSMIRAVHGCLTMLYLLLLCWVVLTQLRNNDRIVVERVFISPFTCNQIQTASFWETIHLPGCFEWCYHANDCCQTELTACSLLNNDGLILLPLLFTTSHYEPGLLLGPWFDHPITVAQCLQGVLSFGSTFP